VFLFDDLIGWVTFAGPRDQPRDAVLVIAIGLAKLTDKPPLLEDAADDYVQRQAEIERQKARGHQRGKPDKEQSGGIERVADMAIEAVDHQLAPVRGLRMGYLAQSEKVQRVGLQQAKEQQDGGQHLAHGSEQNPGPCQVVERLPRIERVDGENW